MLFSLSFSYLTFNQHHISLHITIIYISPSISTPKKKENVLSTSN